MRDWWGSRSAVSQPDWAHAIQLRKAEGAGRAEKSPRAPGNGVQAPKPQEQNPQERMAGHQAVDGKAYGVDSSAFQPGGVGAQEARCSN